MPLLSVAAGLETAQPVVDVARAPPDLARADVARAGEVPAARAAIEGGSRLEASDVQHVGHGQKLVSIRWHCDVLSFVGMQDVAQRGGRCHSVAHSRKFIEQHQPAHWPNRIQAEEEAFAWDFY